VPAAVSCTALEVDAVRVAVFLGKDPIARIRRIAVPAIAVVGGVKVFHEVVAWQHAARASRIQILVIPKNARIEHGDHDRRITPTMTPSPLDIRGRTKQGVRRTQKPLTAFGSASLSGGVQRRSGREQRVVGHRKRSPSLVDDHRLHIRVGAQPCRQGGSRDTKGPHRVAALTHRPYAAQRQPQPCRQGGGAAAIGFARLRGSIASPPGVGPDQRGPVAVGDDDARLLCRRDARLAFCRARSKRR
jgi:hypothetical protein